MDIANERMFMSYEDNFSHLLRELLKSKQQNKHLRQLVRQLTQQVNEFVNEAKNNQILEQRNDVKNGSAKRKYDESVIKVEDGDQRLSSKKKTSSSSSSSSSRENQNTTKENEKHYERNKRIESNNTNKNKNDTYNNSDKINSEKPDYKMKQNGNRSNDIKNIPKRTESIKKVDPKDFQGGRKTKEEREALPGHTCEHCAKWFRSRVDTGIITEEQYEDHLKECSRHKAKYTPPSTPPGLWLLTIPTPPEWKK